MSDATNGMLKSFVERIARLEDAKAEIVDDIKAVKNEAAGEGYDKKVLTQMVKEFRMNESERAAVREFEVVCELYRASLGMLDGTPLGESARKHASEPPPEKREPEDSDDGAEPAPDQSDIEEQAPEFPKEDLSQARERGRADAKAGVKIIQNPYVAGDPRRAAWDAAWCEENSSDGMDIPEYLRRAPKKKSQGKGSADQ